MNDFACDPCGALQEDALGLHGAAFCGAADHHLVGDNAALDDGVFVQDQHLAKHVADDFSFDENVAFAFQVAAHGQPFVDDGLGLPGLVVVALSGD